MRFTIPTSLTVFSEVKALFHAINLFLYWQQKYYMKKMNWTEKNLCVWPKMNIIVCHSTILFTCIFQCHKVEKKTTYQMQTMHFWLLLQCPLFQTDCKRTDQLKDRAPTPISRFGSKPSKTTHTCHTQI